MRPRGWVDPKRGKCRRPGCTNPQHPRYVVCKGHLGDRFYWSSEWWMSKAQKLRERRDARKVARRRRQQKRTRRKNREDIVRRPQ